MRVTNIFYQIPGELQSYILLDSSNQKILVLKNIKLNISFFIKIPINIFFSLKDRNKFQFSSYSLLSLNSFLKILSKQVSILRFPFFVKLFLKGLGFRIQLLLINKERFLDFKLGFSHSIKLKIISENISVAVKKNSLILSGFSKTEIGNLANCIYNLRMPNVYTGKGFRYKRVPLKLKDVKKT